MNHYACWFYSHQQQCYLVYDLRYHFTLIFQTQAELESWADDNDVMLENEIAH